MVVNGSLKKISILKTEKPYIHVYTNINIIKLTISNSTKENQRN